MHALHYNSADMAKYALALLPRNINADPGVAPVQAMENLQLVVDTFVLPPDPVIVPPKPIPT